MLTKAVAEIGAATETTVGSYLHNAPVWLFYQQFGCILQTQLLDVAGELGVVATLGEDGTHTLFRKLEAVHNSLTLKFGVKEELLAMNRNGQKGTEAWEKKAQELSGLADEVSRCAMLYINERKMQAKTPAGRDRLNGAVLLYRESEVARITLKKELAANERYRQMAAKGEQLNASISPDPALTDPVGDANVQKMREYMQKELAEEKRLAEEHRKRDKALSGAMDALGVDKKGLAKQALTDQPAKKKAEERRIKETSFEEMSRQLVLVEKKKETVKRKVDAPVGAPAAPQPEGPRK